jgi:glycosyltransferase involved in cell wall biosynthesis
MFPQVVRIPTYADTEAFRPRPAGARSEEVVFGWNGTLFQKFMYDALLLMLRAFRRASAQLGDSNPSVFEIAGTGSYLAEIRKSLAAEFAGCRVRIRGWIDPRAMAQYLDGIDVGLYSLAMVAEGPNSEDGRFIVCKSPTKVFEYMAKGIPTISTRVGEVAHFLEHGVTGFVSDDEDELVEAFVALATDPGLRDRMGAAARRACVERYSMATATAMLADVLAEVGDVAVRGDAKPSLTGLN